MSVVAHPDQVSVDWLQKVLARNGFTGRVEHVAWQYIGAGQVGDNARFDISGQGELPASLVGKFPSTNATSRQTGVELNNYAREVYFYTDIDPVVDIQTPRVYATEFDAQTHDFIILMEDLAPGVQIDQMSACNSDQASLALVELAKLHGPKWGDTQLAPHPLLATDAAAPGESLYQMLQPGFLERYESRLDEHAQQDVARIGEVDLVGTTYTGPQTLIHIDYRLDNMIFGGPYPIAILDWQSINLGCAMNDVAYFLGTSMEPEQRNKEERALLRQYLDVLNGYGADLQWDEAWQLYSQYAPAGLRMAVIASMIVGETDRGNDMFMTMAHRSLAMCRELETVKLLGG